MKMSVFSGEHVFYTINLAGGLRGDVKQMKHASHQSVCCLFGGRDAGIRHTPKVKLICFVDTLVTLTSVNTEPAIYIYFFSFSLLLQTAVRSITPPVPERAIVCSGTLVCWLEVRMEKS